MRAVPLLALLAVLSAASLLLALTSGSLTLGLEALHDAAAGADNTAAAVIRELRLPRALTAFAVGGLLAVAGTLLQVLLGNPLADPYVLGVSGGAAVGALLAIMLGLAGVPVTVAALTGALIATLLVFGLARGGQGEGSPPRLLLTGVVLAAGWGAAVALLLAVAPEQQLRGMLFWLMGDLSQSGTPLPGLVVLGVGMAAALPVGRSLDLLARGELQASALGVSVGPLRLYLFALASLLTAAAVTLAGSIGFVGLVIPHLMRLAGARHHRLLLPAAALAGGALLVLADTLARTALAPRQLPVGVLTALIGVPLFLWLLRREARR